MIVLLGMGLHYSLGAALRAWVSNFGLGQQWQARGSNVAQGAGTAGKGQWPPGTLTREHDHLRPQLTSLIFILAGQRHTTGELLDSLVHKVPLMRLRAPLLFSLLVLPFSCSRCHALTCSILVLPMYVQGARIPSESDEVLHVNIPT
jgi:hypothetical protein